MNIATRTLGRKWHAAHDVAASTAHAPEQAKRIVVRQADRSKGLMVKVLPPED
jgi:hypothetical protein